MKRQRKGANVIEFALILPVFVALMGGTIDLGWAYFQYSGLSTAVLQGCREGAIVDPGMPDTNGPTSNEIAIKAKAELAIKDTLAAQAVKCVNCAATATFQGTQPTRTLVCVGENDYKPLFGLGIGAMRLRASAARRLEWQR